MIEARLEDGGSGLRPVTEGWFVVNVRDAQWLTTDGGDKQRSGSECPFEGPGGEFGQLGIRLHVLPPGEANGLYHRENQQEGFLVLAGECVLLAEGEERQLHAWDFVHCPPDTGHIFVGVGDEPCVILMAGGRTEPWQVAYPVSEIAGRYGASARAETTDPDQAYADFEPSRHARPSYWGRLPWNGQDRHSLETGDADQVARRSSA